MPQGKGTYGSKKGRPPKKDSKKQSTMKMMKKSVTKMRKKWWILKVRLKRKKWKTLVGKVTLRMVLKRKAEKQCLIAYVKRKNNGI